MTSSIDSDRGSQLECSKADLNDGSSLARDPPDLPGTIWRCIYRKLNTQHEICTGMRVCKILKAVLPELLLKATLQSPCSLVCLPAISASFSCLLLLELYMPPQGTPHTPSVDADLSSLTFPRLRELRLLNNVTSRLVLNEAHHPQLRTLAVETAVANQPLMLSELQLQLPLLLTLELQRCVLESAAALTACLSEPACPRLCFFKAEGITFQDAPYVMVLDMPRLQRLDMRGMNVNALELRAPRLTELILRCCSSLESVTLLPDGEPPYVDTAADAADTAVTTPFRTPEHKLRHGAAAIVAAGLASRFLASAESYEGPALKGCIPCEVKRIKLMEEGLFKWQGTSNYQAFVQEPRVVEVIDLGFSMQDVYDAVVDEESDLDDDFDQPW